MASIGQRLQSVRRKPGHPLCGWCASWAESGGPPVVAPRRRGFGSRLIELGLAQDLGGRVRLDFTPHGVSCAIEAPLDEIQANGGLQPMGAT